MKKGAKIAIIVGAIVIVVGGVGGFVVSKTLSTNTDIEDAGMYFENIMPYQAQDLSDFISVSGTVASESSMNITSSVSAKVTQLNVSIGDYVNVGDVLCVLDSTEIKQQIEDLETNIKNASALDENSKELNRQALKNAKEDQVIQLKQAQETIDDAQEEYDKAYKKYSDSITAINNAVLEYNDICNQIAQYESSMPQEDYSDDYIEDSEAMSFNNLNEYSATNLSYGEDEYSNLISRREELSANIQSYQAECSTYEEQFDGLQKAIETARDNYTSVKRSTDQAIETAQNTVDMQDYQDNSSSSTATQLEQLKKQLSECTVKAEKSGKITSLGIAQGDTATEGSLLMTIENDSQLKITVDIEEGDILKVKEGMNVIVTSEATGETEIKGVVSKVITIVSSNNTPSADGSSGDASGSGGFTAEITINEDSDLLVGMKAKAKIMLVEKSNCYAILYDCIMYDDDGNPYVFVADTSAGDGSTATVKRVDITVGDESDSYVEVSSDELKENDLIITTPYDVTEGDTINLSPYIDYSGGFDMNVDDSMDVVANGEAVVMR